MADIYFYIFTYFQMVEGGDAILCCANKRVDSPKPCGASNHICRYFYDSPPSGTYGTMTYITQSILNFLYGHLIDSNAVYKMS